LSSRNHLVVSGQTTTCSWLWATETHQHKAKNPKHNFQACGSWGSCRGVAVYRMPSAVWAGAVAPMHHHGNMRHLHLTNDEPSSKRRSRVEGGAPCRPVTAQVKGGGRTTTAYVHSGPGGERPPSDVRLAGKQAGRTLRRQVLRHSSTNHRRSVRPIITDTAQGGSRRIGLVALETCSQRVDGHPRAARSQPSY